MKLTFSFEDKFSVGVKTFRKLSHRNTFDYTNQIGKWDEIRTHSGAFQKHCILSQIKRKCK